MRRRVVVTGVGVLSALGANAREFWEALSAGRSGIGPITAVDTSGMRMKNGAEVRGFDPVPFFGEKEADFLDRFAQFGAVAAREALMDSGLELDDGLKARCAVVTGSCVGGQTTEDAQFQTVYLHGRKRVAPLTIPKIMANAGTSRISLETGITGPSWTVSTACSSANHAIGQAFWMVRDGLVEAAITGGCEAPFSYGNLMAWEAIRVVSPDTCRPFARDRRGMILGEGAAMLVIETLEAAQARGAHIYAEIAGFGMSSDAHHLTQPSVDGPAQAMAMALEDAGIALQEIGYINAHGTGTVANDPTEAAAIRRVFGAHTDRIAVSSTKSMHGHTLGAAGAIEGVATVLALERGLMPPTANFTEPDPDCQLDVISNEARPGYPAAALSNSFAFGGLNAVLAFRRWN